MGINLRDHLTGDPSTWITKEEAERIFEAAGYKKRVHKERTVVFERKQAKGSYEGKIKGVRSFFCILRNECVWCGVKFKTQELHDEHYMKCADENHIQPSREEIFDLIHNPNHY